MNIPANLKYTKEHEWVKVDGELVTIGITDYAQAELGDITFIEMPASGSQVKQMEPCGSIEAVKAVSDVFAPLSGEIKEINPELETNPQLVNNDPYGKGWILKIHMNNPVELDALLSADAYQKFINAD